MVFNQTCLNNYFLPIYIYIIYTLLHSERWRAPSVMCFAWVIGEFRIFQHHIHFAKQTLLEKPVSDTSSILFERKNTWLFIHLDDYRPLNRASDGLLQTTNQMRGTLYFYRKIWK